MARSRNRVRSRVAARRTSSSGSASGGRTERSNTLFKYGAPVVGGLMAFLVARKLFAAETPKGLPPDQTPKPNPWPAGTTEARVTAAGYTALNTRTSPSPTAPLVARNDAFNGTIVGILGTGYVETEGGCATCRRYLIMTPGGSIGYARGIGPMGETNFVLTKGALPVGPEDPAKLPVNSGGMGEGSPIMGGGG